MTTISGVRVRPAPAYEPPYDDERSGDRWDLRVVQPLLEPPAPVVLRRRIGQRSTPASPSPSPTATPATTAAAVRFARTCVEILNGYRPVGHFRALASPLAAGAVVEAMVDAGRRLREARRTRHELVRLRSVRTCEPRPGVAELALVVAHTTTHRAWALAYRLERRHGRWLCTAAAML
jgi:hypothetical protein